MSTALPTHATHLQEGDNVLISNAQVGVGQYERAHVSGRHRHLLARWCWRCWSFCVLASCINLRRHGTCDVVRIISQLLAHVGCHATFSFDRDRFGGRPRIGVQVASEPTSAARARHELIHGSLRKGHTYEYGHHNE